MRKSTITPEKVKNHPDLREETIMMTFHLIAKIKWNDGSESELVAVIFHPAQQRLTHLVTRYRDEQRIVPIEHVVSFAERPIPTAL
jgi:hypothetical protein